MSGRPCRPVVRLLGSAPYQSGPASNEWLEARSYIRPSDRPSQRSEDGDTTRTRFHCSGGRPPRAARPGLQRAQRRGHRPDAGPRLARVGRRWPRVHRLHLAGMVEQPRRERARGSSRPRSPSCARSRTSGRPIRLAAPARCSSAKLVEIAPGGLDRIGYTPARQHGRRDRHEAGPAQPAGCRHILALQDAYHGRSWPHGPSWPHPNDAFGPLRPRLRVPPRTPTGRRSGSTRRPTPRCLELRDTIRKGVDGGVAARSSWSRSRATAATRVPRPGTRAFVGSATNRESC